MLFVIYALVDPRISEIRYVGCTSACDVDAIRSYAGVHPDRLAELRAAAVRKSLSNRLIGHVGQARRVGSSSRQWIRDLCAEGLRPVPFAIEFTRSEAVARQLENEWIAYYRAAGCDLANARVSNYRHARRVPRQRREHPNQSKAPGSRMATIRARRASEALILAADEGDSG